MPIDIKDGIESGNLSIKILTVNESSLTLLADPRFVGRIVQPGAAAASFLGEHGLAAYVEVKSGDGKTAILFDTGGLNASILHNLSRMNLKLDDVAKVVISHGHFDHTGSIPKVIPELAPNCELLIHPVAYVQNHAVITKSGEDVPLDDFTKNIRELKKAGQIANETKLPQLNKELIQKLAAERGVKLIETTQPVKICPGCTTSGEIEVVDKGEVTPGFYLVKSKTVTEKHTFRDEITLYFNVKSKGLVVLTGCGHTGIINTIKHGQKITGINKVYAVIGGFHFEMSQGAFIDKEIQALKAFNPEILCGMHCTGLAFNAKMIGQPAHVQGVVGTEFRL